jgi:hypothetical protein
MEPHDPDGCTPLGPPLIASVHSSGNQSVVGDASSVIQPVPLI